MPLSSDLVGRTSPPSVATVDARWVMAYSAALGDVDDRRLDTTRPDGIAAHPLFPVCFEWPVIAGQWALAGEDPGRGRAARGVHASHALVLHRPVRPGDRLTTTGEIVAVTRRPAGARQVVRLSTVDQDGDAVCTTWYGTVFLGVEVEGPDRTLPTAEPPHHLRPALDPQSGASTTIGIDRALPHVYSECSRIWNPIHTDPTAAQAAGLPGTILHGTATLALAVSVLLRRHGIDPADVREVQGRFAAMVEVPSAIEIVVPGAPPGGPTLPFEVRTADGGLAVRDGLLVTAAD